jgi:hypothetical protein
MRVRRVSDHVPGLQRPRQDGRTAAIRAGSAVKHRCRAVDRKRSASVSAAERSEVGRRFEGESIVNGRLRASAARAAVYHLAKERCSAVVLSGRWSEGVGACSVILPTMDPQEEINTTQRGGRRCTYPASLDICRFAILYCDKIRRKEPSFHVKPFGCTELCRSHGRYQTLICTLRLSSRSFYLHARVWFCGLPKSTNPSIPKGM